MPPFYSRPTSTQEVMLCRSYRSNSLEENRNTSRTHGRALTCTRPGKAECVRSIWLKWWRIDMSSVILPAEHSAWIGYDMACSRQRPNATCPPPDTRG